MFFILSAVVESPALIGNKKPPLMPHSPPRQGLYRKRKREFRETDKRTGEEALGRNRAPADQSLSCVSRRFVPIQIVKGLFCARIWIAWPCPNSRGGASSKTVFLKSSSPTQTDTLPLE